MFPSGQVSWVTSLDCEGARLGPPPVFDLHSVSELEESYYSLPLVSVPSWSGFPPKWSSSESLSVQSPWQPLAFYSYIYFCKCYVFRTKESKVKRRWEQITLPTDFPEDEYRDSGSDSDDHWYGSGKASVRRSDTMRSVSSHTSTSSVLSSKFLCSKQS